MNEVEGNKLIAAFIGLEPFEDSRYGLLYTDPTNKNHGSVFGHEGLKYRTSWDWQIPVWSKLAHACQDIAGKPGIDHKFYLSMVDKYESAVFQNNPKEGQKVIVKLLEWYNSNAPLKGGIK